MILKPDLGVWKFSGTVCGGCKNQVEKDDFCTSCGLKLSKFCGTCGKRKLNCSYDNKTGGNAPTKTLQDFVQQKDKERVSFPFTGTSNPPPDRAPLNQRNKYKKRERKTVNITVGLMKLDGHGCLKIKRGSKATIAVAPTADWTVLKHLVLEKHSNLNQYFCMLGDYVLLYPDQKVCLIFCPVRTSLSQWIDTKTF